MLEELYIKNIAIIDELRIAFLPGFNVLTGETGAGKSIILDAMALVLGERADTTLIRNGSDRAYVEALFKLKPNDGLVSESSIASMLEQEGLDDASDILILARELRTNGRNICRVNGQVVNLSLARSLGELLVDIHGQGEHLSLLKPQSHLPLLDAYGRLGSSRLMIEQKVDELRAVQKELNDLQKDERELAQRMDMLTYQIQEIEAANLEPDEDESLRTERLRLANMEKLVEHSNHALSLMEGPYNQLPSILDMVSEAELSVSRLARLDDSLRPLLEELQGLNFQLSEVVSTLRAYQEDLDFAPNRLEYVEERLELFANLKRKYGENIEAILQWKERAATEFEAISHNQDRKEELQTRVETYLKDIGKLASSLSQERKKAAEKMSHEVEIELADLNMEQARFVVSFSVDDQADGVFVDSRRLAFDRTGFDRVEFLISANPGEEPRPLVKVASGGETSRIMLGLKTVLAQIDTTPTLIFDEIDQGIGGRIGGVVGRKLWRLTHSGKHQVIVVTHLPQLAGFGDGHYHVDKHVVSGRTVTIVKNLDGPERIEELAAMLGTRGESASEGALSIIHLAETEKQKAS